jgi:signal transduction histidine kinase
VEAQPRGGFCHIGMHWTGEWLTVTVTNGGFKLSREEGCNIFEPYFTSKTQGTGLGLAISRKIVEAHGGTITARPDSDSQQLTLVIELPATAQARIAAQSKRTTGGAQV